MQLFHVRNVCKCKKKHVYNGHIELKNVRTILNGNRQLFHEKYACKNISKKEHVQNGRTDFKIDLIYS